MKVNQALNKLCELRDLLLPELLAGRVNVFGEGLAGKGDLAR